MSTEDKFQLETQYTDDNVSFKWGSSRRKLWIIITVLAVVLAAAVITVIGLAAGLGVARSSESSESVSEEVCLTDECVQLSARILSSMDQSVDPCQDFYNFTCGRFEDNNVTPLDAGHGGNPGIFFGADILNRQNIRAFHDILTSDVDDNIEAVAKAKDLYRLCLNKEQVNAQSIPQLLDILRETGGWPVLGLPNDETPWSINGSQFMMEKMLRSPAFFGFQVMGDLRDANRYRIFIAQSGLTLMSPDQYQDPIFTEALQMLIVNMLNNLIPLDDNATYVAAADSIIEVERALASINEVIDISTIDNRFTLGQLPEQTNYFYDWVGSLQRIFETAGVTIDESEPLIVATPIYLSQLGAVLNNLSSDALQNYARWQLVRLFVPSLDQECVNAFQQFTNVITNNGIPEREEMCVGMVQEYLPLAVWRPYADTVVTTNAQSAASVMTTDIMAAFRQRVTTRVWLDQETIQRCQNKVDLMTQNIAYPDEILDDDLLNQRYAEFEVLSDSLVRTFANFQRSSLIQMISRLRDRVTLFEIDVPGGPFAINAFYSPAHNQMVILSTIMGAPFFRTEWPT